MKKKNLSTILLVLVFLIGLSLLLYPTVSDYWNSFRQTRAIVDYQSSVSKLDNDTYDKILESARTYNETFLETGTRFNITEEELKKYEQLLNVTGRGIMGYIEIPTINCNLPVYHGVEDSVLQEAVGHLVGTSLPVGGKGTHCVLSGHRGLPRAKLFTDLDRLEKGDLFMLNILDETLTYEVDQILIVEPDEIEELTIEADKDYCTLLTCTPYGINSHRLLVRGHRVANQSGGEVRITADAIRIEPIFVAPLVATVLLAILMILLLIRFRRRNKE
ncbi:MAG: class C sortase [Clostridia bacterium]|nr:class C sortase [Clostridia bacterium]